MAIGSAFMIKEILHKYWGYDSFRPMQEDIINSALQGLDTLALMPTGGGKSICFQVPAMAKEGICLVISPLIALIKDQVQNLNNRGIQALAVYSGMSFSQIDATLDNAIYGSYKFLYVSPERLQTPIFRERVSKMNINFLVVDEAHCISQWGYDFRPAYLNIKDIKPIIGDVPVIALTATATQKVAVDIMNILGFKGHNIISSGFQRKNLSYVVRKTDDKLGNLIKICNGVPGTGIVYVRERRKCEEIYNFLQQNNIEADFYHAGLSKDLRSYKQDSWKCNKIRVIVATNAFGMGIDKPDVRFVIHYDLPDSLEAYFQEAGRAGRDGERSYATLLWNGTDITRLKNIFNTTFPSVEYIKEIYQKVYQFLNVAYEDGAYCIYKFNLMEFARRYALQAASAFYAIKYIEQLGYWELTDEMETPSKIMFIVERDELYSVQLKNPQLDAFIKSILRMYTGLFSKMTAIDIDYIAKVTMDTSFGVNEKLVLLKQKGIIKYAPKVRTPLLISNSERLTESNFYMSQKEYQNRKDMFGSRIEGVINYVKCEDICRSKLLLDYFSQPAADDCGICDVCISNKNNLEYKSKSVLVRDEIIKIVKEKKQIPVSAIESMAGDEYLFYLSVMRLMADNNEIKIVDGVVSF